MENLKNKIELLSKDVHAEVIEIRRYIHQNPELSFQEFNTVKFIKSKLDKYGIKYDESFGENSLIGIIDGDLPGETIALRADTDALPLVELNSCEYKSVNDGVMHACGHDAHTASLIGTAIVLQNLKSIIKGRIILVFQPAEEKIPGGAKILVEKGLLKKYNIKKIIGQHVLPEMPTGHFCFAPGYLMAATDELYIRFEGVGGHAAVPQKRSDTVLAVVEFIHEVKEMQKRLKSDLPFIVAFGRLIADGVLNVIPSKTSADGTMRTFDEGLRLEIKKNLKQIAEKVAVENKCTFDLEIRDGYPSVYNDPDLTATIISAAKEYIGESNVENMELRMTAEDFAYFGKEIPAVFYRMGIAGDGKGMTGLHNPSFDMDESAFVHSVGLMAWLAINM
jgi:amidohydrolase